jgi:hypothetical protein
MMASNVVRVMINSLVIPERLGGLYPAIIPDQCSLEIFKIH